MSNAAIYALIKIAEEKIGDSHDGMKRVKSMIGTMLPLLRHADKQVNDETSQLLVELITGLRSKEERKMK